jgi:hypothetical protein
MRNVSYKTPAEVYFAGVVDATFVLPKKQAKQGADVGIVDNSQASYPTIPTSHQQILFNNIRSRSC